MPDGPCGGSRWKGSDRRTLRNQSKIMVIHGERTGRGRARSPEYSTRFETNTHSGVGGACDNDGGRTPGMIEEARRVDRAGPGSNVSPLAVTIEAGAVGVVIPVHRAGSGLIDAIASIEGGTLAPAWIVVIDNASGDDAVDRAAAAFPGIDVIRNATNLGFGRACNQGIERLMDRGAAFVFLLNQDATVDPDTLRSLRSLCLTHPRAAVIGAKTLSSVMFDGDSPILLYGGAWRSCFPLWQRVPGVGRADHAGDHEPRLVNFVWGHAMFIRVSALADVGHFDPAFFMYYEDLDLCDRLQTAGWEVWCDRRAVARHAITDPSRAKQSELRRWRWKQESGRSFCRKRWQWPISDAFWLASAGRELMSLCRRGYWRAAGHLVWASIGVFIGQQGCTSAPARRSTGQ